MCRDKFINALALATLSLVPRTEHLSWVVSVVPKSHKPIKHIYLQSKACSAGDSAYIMCSLICFISNYFWYDSVCLLTAEVDYRCCWIHLPNKFHLKGFQFIWSEATLQSEPKSVNQRYERAGLYQQAVVDVSQAFSQHLCSLNTACQVANVRFIMQYPCYWWNSIVWAKCLESASPSGRLFKEKTKLFSRPVVSKWFDHLPHQ